MIAWGSYIHLLGNMKWFSRPGSIAWSLLPLPVAGWFIYDMVSMILLTSMIYLKIVIAMAVASMVLIAVLLFAVPQAFYALRDQLDSTINLKGRYPRYS